LIGVLFQGGGPVKKKCLMGPRPFPCEIAKNYGDTMGGETKPGDRGKGPPRPSLIYLWGPAIGMGMGLEKKAKRMYRQAR